MFKIGTKIIWLDGRTIRSGIVTAMSRDRKQLWVDRHLKPEDHLKSLNVWPDCEETRSLLEDTVSQIIRHERQHNDLMDRTANVRKGLK